MLRSESEPANVLPDATLDTDGLAIVCMKTTGGGICTIQ